MEAAFLLPLEAAFFCCPVAMSPTLNTSQTTGYFRMIHIWLPVLTSIILMAKLKGKKKEKGKN